MTTAILVVSHSRQLAQGVCELAGQMAPDVTLRAVGGTDDGRLGTSVDAVSAALEELLAEPGGVVVLTDLGSATMTTELALEMLGTDRAVLADAPLVEGAVAAAVAAQTGAAPAQVRDAAQEAALIFPAAQRGGTVGGAGSAGHAGHAGSAGEAAESDGADAGGAGGGGVPGGGPANGAGDGQQTVERVLALRNELGLHARPAAMLARLVAGFDAEVEVNGVDGASVLALMGLDLPGGAQMSVRAAGPQAEQVLDAVAQIVEDRFGEE